MAKTAAPSAGPDPAALFTPTIRTDTEVKVRSPRAGESGTWRVTGQVAKTSPDDPAYDVIHTVSGRRRIFRSSRLTIVREPQGSAAPRKDRTTRKTRSPQEVTC